MDCNPASAEGHHHIIVAVDYFTKSAEAMPMIKSDGETATHFVFNQIITQFGILKELVTDHGRHFHNRMMEELASKLGYKQENSSSYYPQANGQVEAVISPLRPFYKESLHKEKLAGISCFALFYGHIEPHSRLPPDSLLLS